MSDGRAEVPLVGQITIMITGTASFSVTGMLVNRHTGRRQRVQSVEYRTFSEAAEAALQIAGPFVVAIGELEQVGPFKGLTVVEAGHG